MRNMRVVHWKKEPYDVYIGRPSIYGNPFSIKKHGRKRCIELYEEYAINRMTEDTEFYNAVKALYGKVLGCWCSPEACHGNVLVELSEPTLL